MLIFSVYLLALPVVSCAESLACADEIEICQAADDCTEDCTDERPDGCDSFCSCSCCVHIVSVNFPVPQFTELKPVISNELLNTYTDIFLPSNHFGNIWQPPRIA